MSLDELRENIDRIDGEIVKLLDDRAETAREIALAKQRLSLPLHNPGRENQVLHSLSLLSRGSMPPERLARIYRMIMAETLDHERDFLAERCPGPKPGAGKIDVVAKITENRPTAPGFWRMRLRAPELAGAFQPGQFFQFSVRNGRSDPFLRRPFAPAELFDDGFAFVYARVGRGTGLMTELAAGDEARVLAPLGRGYALPPKGVKAALVGGGCGGPSLGPLAKALTTNGVNAVIVLGARSAGSLIGMDCFSEKRHTLVAATDDGSRGFAGTSLQALEDKLGGDIASIAKIYACGPIPMLKAAWQLAAKHGIRCEVSLEERMACGFGACVGCAVETKNPDGTASYKRVCHDGPVFDAYEIVWN